MRILHSLIAAVPLLLALAPARADEFKKEDLERWQAQFMSVVQEGRKLCTSAQLGTNGVAYVNHERRGVKLEPGKH